MRLRVLTLVLGLAVVVSGCGSDDGDSGGMSATPPKVPSIKQFPKTNGRTLNEVAESAQAGPALAPAVSYLLPGKNRFAFGLFDRERKQIADAPGALYVARDPDSPASGPYVARWESLEVKGRFLSKNVSTDPDAAKTLYVAELPFKKPGRYAVLGLFRLDNRLVGAGTTVEVVKGSNIPGVGDKAPKMSTPTEDDVGGDLSKIDTRDPHDSMHDVDYADVLGKRPIVLLFSTPALCQTRVCGPVVDITEQMKHNGPKTDAAWIHMEIYNNNKIADGPRPQFLKYNLPGEPWLFTIDRRGRIAAAIEGAFSASELEKALLAATKD